MTMAEEWLRLRTALVELLAAMFAPSCVRERDEARAEVERLRRNVDHQEADDRLCLRCSEPWPCITWVIEAEAARAAPDEETT
jgi:hypothetical protein